MSPVKTGTSNARYKIIVRRQIANKIIVKKDYQQNNCPKNDYGQNYCEPNNYQRTCLPLVTNQDPVPVHTVITM